MSIVPNLEALPPSARRSCPCSGTGSSKPALDLGPARATRRRQVGADAVGDAGEPCCDLLQALAKWAARRGLMRGGFGELERPAPAAKKQLVLSQADVGELLRSLGKSSRDIVIRVMLLTGARCNEVCMAVWSEFDLDRGVWTLPGLRRRNPKPGRLLPDHVMPLPAGLVVLLRTIGPGEPDKLAFPAPVAR